MTKQTMTAAVLYGKEDVRIQSVDIPDVGPGDVLVKIETALTCGTDLKVYKRGYHSKMIQPPAVFGHEFSGTIDKTGSKVTNFKPGMRVVAANSAPCGDCFFCKKDQPNLCADLLFINGAYAQYILLPERIVQKNLLLVSENVSMRDAALTEPLACAAKGIDDSQVQAQDTVLVLGAGPMSLLLIQLSKIKGASVWVTDMVDEKLSLAQKLGADHTINIRDIKEPVQEIKDMSPDKHGFDVVIDATGNPNCWEQAVHLTRKGGLVNFFGGCPTGSSIHLDTNLLHYSQLTLKASFHHTPAYIRKAFELISNGKINTDLLIQHEEALEMLPKILSDMATNNMNGRAYSPKTAIIP
ncbi:MAG: alcohol dehydrogenase catalytic domain-containing protein [Chlamydiota bacterium]|nr:alcohol dehydrogenase catalytic domain-containing protein [Chlamydiota bacterium]